MPASLACALFPSATRLKKAASTIAAMAVPTDTPMGKVAPIKVAIAVKAALTPPALVFPGGVMSQVAGIFSPVMPMTAKNIRN